MGNKAKWRNETISLHFFGNQNGGSGEPANSLDEPFIPGGQLGSIVKGHVLVMQLVVANLMDSRNRELLRVHVAVSTTVQGEGLRVMTEGSREDGGAIDFGVNSIKFDD